jgi:hypothetical protein
LLPGSEPNGRDGVLVKPAPGHAGCAVARPGDNGYFAVAGMGRLVPVMSRN